MSFNYLWAGQAEDLGAGGDQGGQQYTANQQAQLQHIDLNIKICSLGSSSKIPESFMLR